MTRIQWFTVLAGGIASFIVLSVSAAAPPKQPEKVCIESEGDCPTKPGPVAGAGIKWHPGHYVQLPGLWDTPEVRARNFRIIDTLTPGKWKGVILVQYWRYFSTERGSIAPGKNMIDAYIAKLAPLGLHLIVMPYERIYGSGSYESQLNAGDFFPLYLKNDPQYADPSPGVSPGGWYNLMKTDGSIGSGRMVVMCAMHRASVMNAYNEMITLLGKEYDDNPTFEAIEYPSTSVGMTKAQFAEFGFDHRQFMTQVERWVVNARAAFPNTIVHVRADFALDSAVPHFAHVMDAQKAAWGGYDTADYLNQNGSGGHEAELDRWYRGAGADGIDRRDVVPFINSVEGASLRFNTKIGISSPAAVGLEEIWQVAASYHATHMKWSYITGGTDITWAQVKNFVEVTKKGAVPRTACPSSFPSCITR